MRPTFAFVFSILLLAGQFRFASAADTGVDFVRDIQPILKETCYSCHGAEKQKGQLRLDTKKLAMQGGTTGVSIIPGDSKKSYLMARLRGEGEEKRMPEKAPALSDAQIALFAKWIDGGAQWPERASVADATLKKHWAYQKPVRSALPTVANKTWVKNPIDAFILARLEQEGLAPSPEAPKETLLRRAALDLTGLPPSPEELNAFVKDTSPDAYEKAVDRLLASPRYGERWARVWLDLSRYADTEGFNFDSPRTMWKFRDWLIAALNADMPFDRFTNDVIAGDMHTNATPEQVIAAGFHRNTMKNTEGGVDPEEARWETLLDRTHTTATVWLGSTLACAQCHNHKFDPFSQKDFYAFLAFFDNSDEVVVDAATGMSLKAVRKDLLKGEELEGDAPAPASGKAAKAEPAKKPAPKPSATITALTFQERMTPAQTDLRLRGAFTSKGERVSAEVPKFLPPLPADAPKNRVGLAEWLTSPENPLTARVTVNRYWEVLFARGLLETIEDFGTQGEKPTHPELLDWLALEFQQSGWKTKALQRLIVTSATYRQSSKLTPALRERDPYNKLYARAPRFRLEAEAIRDNALAISGLLSPKIGGPSVFPPVPGSDRANNKVNTNWNVSAGEDRFRRGIYTYVRRTSPFAMMSTFDGTSREFCTVKRTRTNTPMQALTALNDPAFFEFAQGLAQRLLKEGGPTPEARLAHGFKLCTARGPKPDEQKALLAAYEKELQSFTTNSAAAQAVTKGVLPVPAGANVSELAALTMLANVLLNLDETVTRE